MADMTPEELAAFRERKRLAMRAIRAQWTPEQRAAVNANGRRRKAAKYRALKPEDRRLRGARNRDRAKEIQAAATPEERERRLALKRAQRKRWYDSHRDAAIEDMRRQREALPEHEKQRRRAAARERSAAWRAARTEEQKREIVAYQARYNAERKKVDPAFRVMADIRGRLRHARDRRCQVRTDSRTIEMLGCSWKAFAAFLETQFEPGMTWENKSRRTWHIDHIVPLAAFDLSIDAEARVAANYLNHRPAWAADNLAKSARMPDPRGIDPALASMCISLDPDFFKRSTRRRTSR